MKTRKTPRKTMKEIRLEEYVRGFYDCLFMFEDSWRQELNRNMPQGTPQSDFLWNIIERAQKKISDVDLKYKKIMLPRVYGTDPENIK